MQQPQEKDRPDTGATIGNLSTIRVSLIKLGVVSSHLFSVLHEMLKKFSVVRTGDVAGLPEYQSNSKARFHLDLTHGTFKLNVVAGQVTSAWKDLAASKKSFATIALVHARRNTEAQLEAIFQEFRSLQQWHPQARLILIDPDEAQVKTITKNMRALPWRNTPKDNTERTMHALVHEVLQTIVQSIHDSLNPHEGQRGPGLLSPMDEKIGQESKQKREEREAARYIKHSGDLCLLASDYASAQSYFKQASNALDRVGDQVWHGASLEGQACALYSSKMQAVGSRSPDFDAAGFDSWVAEVVNYYHEAMAMFEAGGCPTLRVEAGFRLARFLTDTKAPRAHILQVVFDTFGYARALNNQTPVITALAELCVSLGFRRKAALLMRISAQHAFMKGSYEQSLKLYIPAAQLLRVPIQWESERPVLVATKPRANAQGWDFLQFLLLKEAIQVAEALKKTVPDFGLHSQLALYTLAEYAHVTDQQWAYSTLLSLSRAKSGLPLLSSSLPCTVTPLSLEDHLRKEAFVVRTGPQVFLFNKFIDTDNKAAAKPAWMVGTIGRLSLSLTNVLSIPLTFSSICVHVNNGHVIAKPRVTIGPKKTKEVIVGVRPLNEGTLTVTALDVTVSPEKATFAGGSVNSLVSSSMNNVAAASGSGSSLMVSPTERHCSFTVPVDPPVEVSVSENMPLLWVYPKNGAEHHVSLALLTGQQSSFTLILHNIGSMPVDALRLTLSSKNGDAGHLQVYYDTTAVENALPIKPGTELEVLVTVAAPQLPLSHRKFMLQIAVRYGTGGEERQLVGTEAVRNLDNSNWETYLVPRRTVVIPVAVAVSDGLFCSSCVKTECGRFMSVKLVNYHARALSVLNTPYQKHVCTTLRHPFFTPVSRHIPLDNRMAAASPAEFTPAAERVVVPSQSIATLLIPVHQFSDAADVVPGKLSLPWATQSNKAKGSIPLQSPSRPVSSSAIAFVPAPKLPTVVFCDVDHDGETLSVELTLAPEAEEDLDDYLSPADFAKSANGLVSAPSSSAAAYRRPGAGEQDDEDEDGRSGGNSPGEGVASPGRSPGAPVVSFAGSGGSPGGEGGAGGGFGGNDSNGSSGGGGNAGRGNNGIGNNNYNNDNNNNNGGNSNRERNDGSVASSNNNNNSTNNTNANNEGNRNSSSNNNNNSTNNTNANYEGNRNSSSNNRDSANAGSDVDGSTTAAATTTTTTTANDNNNNNNNNGHNNPNHNHHSNSHNSTRNHLVGSLRETEPASPAAHEPFTPPAMSLSQTAVSESTCRAAPKLVVALHQYYSCSVRLLPTVARQPPFSRQTVKLGFVQKSSKPDTVHAARDISLEGATTACLLPSKDVHSFSLAVHVPGTIIVQVLLTSKSTKHVHAFPVQCINTHMMKANA
ncbi:trafficking protein particle complex subunit 9 [Diplonema papillatum]|nr:trafficking protein particle complex subunit 9 [Diplonema papillatum]